MFLGRRRRREEQLFAAERWRAARRLLEEDVTVLGEQLSELHIDTLTDDLDPVQQEHYRRALDHYDQARTKLTAATTAEEVLGIEQVTADARYHRAAVLALRDGEPLPERREPCFFNPQHGPSMQDVEWTPAGGEARHIGVCAADARRLVAGEEPLVRLVRVGDRWVPWHQSGGGRSVADSALMLTSQSQNSRIHGALAHITRMDRGWMGR